MAKYRNALPQLEGGLFLTDGGLETTLVFHDKLPLPEFAAFPLLRDAGGPERLRAYFERYLAIAKEAGAGFVLESVTWRANADWGAKLGYDMASLAEVNREAIAMLEALRAAHEATMGPMVISGNIGPRGDGYVPSTVMSAAEAEDYHRPQVATFAETAADMVSAFTINYVEEALGIVHAAQSAGMPVAISFTVETDGALPTGQSLRAAVEQVDAETRGYPAYYMINCAHPTHFAHVLEGGAWIGRIRGLRANASCRSHAELNEAVELDAGDPEEWGAQHVALKQGALAHLNVLGGCCGTDHRHVAAIARACSAGSRG